MAGRNKFISIVALSGVLALLVGLPESFAATDSQNNSWVPRDNWGSPSSQSMSSSSKRIGRHEREARTNSTPFAPETHNVSLELGQAFLMGDLGDNFSDAIRYQLHYAYGVSDIFAFDSSLGYSDHSDGKFTMTSLTAGIRTNLSWYDRVIPYAELGLGFYEPSRRITPTNSVSSMLFGIHMGPGVSLALSKQFFFGASITFHDVFGNTKKTSSGDIDMGGTFTTFLLHTGVTF